MISYSKFSLIIILICIHLSDGRPLVEIGKELGNMASDLGTVLESADTLSPLPRGKEDMKELKNIKEQELAVGKKVLEESIRNKAPKLLTAPVSPPEVINTVHKIEGDITDPQGTIILRKEDLEFLENVARGLNRESYKLMSDKIFHALESNYNRVNQPVKDNQLFKAFIQNAHNTSQGIISAYAAIKERSLSEFLHDWYKIEYKPKKGEIREVEMAINAENEVANVPASSQPPQHADERGKEVHEAAKKVGVERYSQAHLLKDLKNEHQMGSAQHMDVIPTVMEGTSTSQESKATEPNMMASNDHGETSTTEVIKSSEPSMLANNEKGEESGIRQGGPGADHMDEHQDKSVQHMDVDPIGEEGASTPEESKGSEPSMLANNDHGEESGLKQDQGESVQHMDISLSDEEGASTTEEFKIKGTKPSMLANNDLDKNLRQGGPNMDEMDDVESSTQDASSEEPSNSSEETNEASAD